MQRDAILVKYGEYINNNMSRCQRSVDDSKISDQSPFRDDQSRLAIRIKLASKALNGIAGQAYKATREDHSLHKADQLTAVARLVKQKNKKTFDSRILGIGVHRPHSRQANDLRQNKI